MLLALATGMICGFVPQTLEGECELKIKSFFNGENRTGEFRTEILPKHGW